jgi:predicted permease
LSNLILIFVCLILGIVLKRAKIVPENFHSSLNAFVINISLSAFSLYYISKIELNSSVIFPALVPWIGIFFAIIFFYILGKIFSWKHSVIGALIMCAGFGNTSFIGIPVIQALYGEEGLKTVMLVDQPGFIALSTVGILVANFYSGSKDSLLKHLTKIIKFPPFIAFIIALILNAFSIEIPKEIDETLLKLGSTTVPLALVSVGSQMKWKKIEKQEGFYLFLGLTFKLILYPLLILVLYKYFFLQNGKIIDISVLESAMAHMISRFLSPPYNKYLFHSLSSNADCDICACGTCLPANLPS